MSFNDTLTAGQITQVRETKQDFQHYMLITPNDIVWQAEVDDSKTDVVYGNFEWTNTLQGAFGDIIAGQTVLITDSTTDFTAPIIRGRTRLVPGATTFNINETGINTRKVSAEEVSAILLSIHFLCNEMFPSFI